MRLLAEPAAQREHARAAGRAQEALEARRASLAKRPIRLRQEARLERSQPVKPIPRAERMEPRVNWARRTQERQSQARWMRMGGRALPGLRGPLVVPAEVVEVAGATPELVVAAAQVVAEAKAAKVELPEARASRSCRMRAP